MSPRSLAAPLALSAALISAVPLGAQNAPTQSLPLRQVVLYSSGVGYFQRSGTVTGAANVDLSFPTEKINDILKSLVLIDPQGGARTVAYPTQASIARRLRKPGQALNAGISLGSLLSQFQGAQVRLTQAGGQPVEGRIVSVHVKSVPVKDAGTGQADYLNLLTASGLRSIPLEQVAEVTLLDERLDRELRESLELLATGLDDQRQAVQLRFSGNGPREIKAGYLQEMPVWKTSYRLVLDKAEKPYLQGWAIVENTTDEDWKDVRLSLISGRPISFIQDLYQPLYVPRPVVEPQVVGSPVPQAYQEALTGGFGGFGGGGLGGGMGGFGSAGGLLPPGVQSKTGHPLDNSLLVGPEHRVTMQLTAVPLREAIRRVLANSGQQFSINPGVPDVPITLKLNDVGSLAAVRLILRQTRVPGLTFSKDGDILLVRINRDNAGTPPEVEAAPPEFTDTGVNGLKQSINDSLVAGGTDRGALFSYDIRQLVTITRQQAVMVPIVSASVDGEEVSIYDPLSHGEHVLNGFLLKNTTGLHLSGGPITVFRDGTYAGDAQISHLQPKEDRLLSYAVDLDVVTDYQAPRFSTETLTVSAKSGVLLVTRKQQEESVYKFRNKSDRSKTVIVQQPVQEGWTLKVPEKPAEQTSGEFRFRLTVPAGKNAELKVVTEHPLSQSLALTDMNVDGLTAYAQNAEVPEKLRAALKQLIVLRRKASDLQSQRAALEAELKTIDQDQARIRQNIGALDRTSPLYQTYVKKLTEQEARIEKLRGEIARLQEAEKAGQVELRAFLDGLTIDG